MEDIAQLKPEGAQEYGEVLEIPVLSVNRGAPLINVKAVDKMGEPYQAGFAAGAAECAEQLEAEKSRLAALGADLKIALRGIDERCRNECAGLIEQLFAALAPTIARGSVHAEIRAIVHKYAVEKKQPITIRVHPSLAEELSMGDAEDVSDAARISIESDEQLNPNAVEISWADGGMFYDPDSLINDISNVFADKDTSNEE